MRRCFRNLKGVLKPCEHSRRAIANRYRDRASVYWVERGEAASENASGEGISGGTRFEQRQEEIESSPGDLETAANGWIQSDKL